MLSVALAFAGPGDFHMIKTGTALAAGICLSFALANPASALNTRTWVSGAGIDQAGCGPIANPCRTLQYAHDNTAAGGEIDVKDSAGYGALTITKGITIIANGVTAGVLAAPSSNGIFLLGNTNDRIHLQGLTIEGSGLGYNGIVLNAGSILTIVSCVVRGFTNVGIALYPSANARISISDTTISANAKQGIYYAGSQSSQVSLVATRLLIDDNETGIDLSPTNGSLNAEIGDTIVSHNSQKGIQVQGNTYAIIDNSRMIRNQYGLRVVSSAVVFLRRSTVFGNTVAGVDVGSGATGYSYRDNSIHANATDISPTPAALQTAQPQ